PTGFEYIALPGRGFSRHPVRAAKCTLDILKAYDLARKKMNAILKAHTHAPDKKCRAILVGIGGFASVPAVFAAGRLALPLAMINVDIVPGKANRLLAPFMQRIFTQFPETAPHFARHSPKTQVFGCPLRQNFHDLDPRKAIRDLKLHATRKILLITGASSGSLSINNAVSALLPRLTHFADTWQIVHLTGSAANTRELETRCAEARIECRFLDYYDDMAALLAAADLVVGRAGAVSIAEFAATGTPAVCLPYPYHKDRHQYLNAETLVGAGAAVIVDDLPEDPQVTADKLFTALETLMADDAQRARMAEAARKAARPDAAEAIARELAQIAR
ncbi:MAG: UDP-N-acetylglucosamine--N-acetylmuramyl-(pentapeptide) pyrophosphoryl-undecaprenol N-acetylglucosamine transferase, partial [Phycisphaerae bacterium]|nr:UDP-N-acetylglucosamine--N-acetylmuramyl-(pentapeptide) pyrophosphoryl-undecaprenol N-acetylglucosamine transferase [Phycisphaerae bacterium]